MYIYFWKRVVCLVLQKVNLSAIIFVTKNLSKLQEMESAFKKFMFTVLLLQWFKKQNEKVSTCFILSLIT